MAGVFLFLFLFLWRLSAVLVSSVSVSVLVAVASIRWVFGRSLRVFLAEEMGCQLGREFAGEIRSPCDFDDRDDLQ